MALTVGQQKALDLAKAGKNIFLSGGGGVGKTYVAQKIIGELKKAGKEVLITASTGKAAMLLGGVTCHSAFHIPIKLTWTAEGTILKKDPLYLVDTVIIDEISMLRIDVFEYVYQCIDFVNRERKKKEMRPIQLIVIGDFCQLPPVIINPTDGSPSERELMSQYYGFDIGLGFAFLAPSWKACNFETVELTEVIRQSDSGMINALNDIRFGGKKGIDYLKNHMRTEPFKESDGAVYLCGKNRTADRINKLALAKINEKSVKYIAEEEGQVFEEDKPAPPYIELKKGAHVLMLQNSTKYRNGSTGTVVSLEEDFIHVRIDETGEIVPVERYTWNVERYEIRKGKLQKTLVGMYRQFPLRLGYAITIHKSQGQSYDKAMLMLGEYSSEIFVYGQFYVAVSRVRSIDGLYIDGNLSNINILASPDVVAFYNHDKNDKTGIQEQEPEKEGNVKKSWKKPTSKKTGMTRIDLESNQIINRVAWTYISTLSRDAVRDEKGFIVPDRYVSNVKDFLENLQK